MPVADLTRKDVITVLEPLAKAGSHVQANRLPAYFRRACNWALGKETLAANPCAGIKRYREQPKERFLSDAEIARFLKNLPDCCMGADHADALRIILLIGMRPGEVVTLTAEAVDLEQRTVRLTNTKASRSHTLPLGAQAFEIVRARKVEAEARQAAEKPHTSAQAVPWLFPNPDTQAGHLRSDALPGALQAAVPKLKMLPATPHDLRRSFATGLARIGCPRLLISLALNHAISGITSIHGRHGYEAELHEWFEKWDEHMASLKRRGKVQKLKAAQ